MSFRPYKFVVQAVIQSVDEDDIVITEVNAEPVVLFGCDNLAEWAKEFPENLANAQIAQQDGQVIQPVPQVKEAHAH